MDRSDDTSADGSADKSVDESADGRWLTYRELAQLRGIDIASAKRQANRGRWRRQKGNSGREVRVLVPAALSADRSTDATGDASTDRTADASADISSIVSAFETALTALREQLQRAEQGRDRAELATTELRIQLEAALREAQAAAQAVDELLRQDAARKARGLLTRLRAAWRGE